MSEVDELRGAIAKAAYYADQPDVVALNAANPGRIDAWDGWLEREGGSRYHRIADAIFVEALTPMLRRLFTAEEALRRICSDEVWNGADDPEDAMHQIAVEALRPLVAAEAIRDAPAAPLSASGAESDHGGRRDGEGLG